MGALRTVLACVLSVSVLSARSVADDAIGNATQGISPAPGVFFTVQVVDEATGRGVPMVELTTTSHISYVTDSAGRAAILEPGLMGRKVWFTVSSHGYTFRPDGFGMKGFATVLEPGAEKIIKITRTNIAERLYSVTGQGIYRDTVLLGLPAPLRQPVVNGQVMGQDSICTARYRGKLYWFWGDTAQPGYPMGHFGTAGAVSRPPEELDPSIGIDLEYYVGDDGFSRAVFDTSRPGPMWMGSLMTVAEKGRERLVTYYMRVKDVGQMLEHGIAVWNDDSERFERRAEWPLDAPVTPERHPVTVRESDGSTWLYFCSPFPVVRVRAKLDDILDPAAYEAYTCLRSGGRSDADIERHASGRPVWGWKCDAPLYRTPLAYYKGDRPGESQAASDIHLLDIETCKPLIFQSGSVNYNAYRGKWIMLANQFYGDSLLGEVWYAEADTFLGPWAYARKIVTHHNYSFYNVMHHPYFDQEDGRLVYFEGTYSAMFTDNKKPTPRYDYNQIMYRLDLSDERLHLPSPKDKSVGWSLHPQ